MRKRMVPPSAHWPRSSAASAAIHPPQHHPRSAPPAPQASPAPPPHRRRQFAHGHAASAAQRREQANQTPGRQDMHPCRQQSAHLPDALAHRRLPQGGSSIFSPPARHHGTSCPCCLRAWNVLAKSETRRFLWWVFRQKGYSTDALSADNHGARCHTCMPCRRSIRSTCCPALLSACWSARPAWAAAR